MALWHHCGGNTSTIYNTRVILQLLQTAINNTMFSIIQQEAGEAA